MSERDDAIGLAKTVASPPPDPPGGEGPPPDPAGGNPSNLPAGDIGLTATDPGASGRRRPGPAEGEADPLIGSRLAHFLVQRKLGQGGMGQVYLATDLALDRPVALKILTGEIASRPALRERFYREARAQARIHHPNVAHIYYIGEEKGRLFYAMEYIEGESVQQLLERERSLAPERALELCRMAAQGLSEGWRSGFAHRDVKPSNLMIDRHGILKVLDFGLVKEIGGTRTDVSLSQESAVLGTPLYISPEQARGEEIDFRSDLYSLGVTLHQMVSGRPPFEGETPIAVISRHLADVRPRLALEGRHRRLRAGLDLLCDRMMAKRRDERFASYADLIAAIERLSAAHSPPAGFWVRGFAAAFDFCALSVLLIPFAMAGIEGKLVLPIVALPYSILPTARWGKTLGKKLLQIEVTPADRAGPVGFRRALVRFLVLLGPWYVLVGGGDLIQTFGGNTGPAGVIAVAMIALGFAIPFILGITASFAPGKRALWDRAARTQVRYVLR